MTCDGRIGGSGFNFFNPIKAGNTTGNANVGKTDNVQTNIQITTTNSVGRQDLSGTIADISGKAQINAPAAQGLATAEEITNGQLVSGYHFDDLGPCNTKLFAIKYNSADVPRIKDGTNNACEGIEYAGVTSNITNPNGPFAELFA